MCIRDSTYMLDLGANADCTSEHLLQFAIMGHVVAADIVGLAQPRIGLLNIGEEEIKGTEMIRHAASLLAASGLNYVGLPEAGGLASGAAAGAGGAGRTACVARNTLEGPARML